MHVSVESDHRRFVCFAPRTRSRTFDLFTSAHQQVGECLPELDVEYAIEDEVDGEVDQLEKVGDDDSQLEELELGLDDVLLEESEDLGWSDERDEDDDQSDQGRCDAVTGVRLGLDRGRGDHARLLELLGSTQSSHETNVADAEHSQWDEDSQDGVRDVVDEQGGFVSRVEPADRPLQVGTVESQLTVGFIVRVRLVK